MPGPIELLIVVFLAAASLFWIVVLVDCLRNEPFGNEKLVWALVIVLTSFVGAALYLLLRRPKRIQQHGK